MVFPLPIICSNRENLGAKETPALPHQASTRTCSPHSFDGRRSTGAAGPHPAQAQTPHTRASRTGLPGGRHAQRRMEYGLQGPVPYRGRRVLLSAHCDRQPQPLFAGLSCFCWAIMACPRWIRWAFSLSSHVSFRNMDCPLPFAPTTTVQSSYRLTALRSFMPLYCIYCMNAPDTLFAVSGTRLRQKYRLCGANTLWSVRRRVSYKPRRYGGVVGVGAVVPVLGHSLLCSQRYAVATRSNDGFGIQRPGAHRRLSTGMVKTKWLCPALLQ